MNHKEIHLAPDRAQSWTFVNTLMNLSVAENVGKSLGKVSKNGARESWPVREWSRQCWPMCQQHS